jgi:hypothetical protein
VIAPAIFVAFVIGLLVEATVLFVLDRRAIAREAAWWEELRSQALEDYGRVFDWEVDLP